MMMRSSCTGPTSVVFPDWRGTVTSTISYRYEPSSSRSVATSATSCCQGMNGRPSAAAIFPMRAPSDRADKSRAVAYFGAATAGAASIVT